ncbi:MAG: bile acid:sodium symporter [Patescibacteria group bacterium]
MYIFILLASLALGLILPHYAVLLAPYSTIFLGIIFFLSALKIDLKEVSRYLKDRKMIVLANAIMLVIYPLIVYYLMRFIYPDLALAFLLLAAMPAGMTSPLLAEICGGRQSLALVLTVTTSLLAPFTIPLVIKYTVGAEISVDVFSLFLTLVKVIFVPFILANVVKYIWPKKIKAWFPALSPISMALLGLIILGIVATQAATILGGVNAKFLLTLLALFLLFIAFHLVGYYSVYWRDRADRISITICLTYMNFILAIYLAGKYFNQPGVVVPVILSVLPWSLLIIPFKFMLRKSQ